MAEYRTLPCSKSRLFVARWFCAILAAGALLPWAAAEGDGNDPYREFVRRVSAGDLSVDFRAFRLACLKASICDPGGDIKDRLSIHRSIQTKDFGKALKTAQTMIEHGFVNIDAHLVCSQAYEALNNADRAKFHHEVAASLIRSILATGDGKTKETAFEVIGAFEEFRIMNLLGLRLGSQALIPGKPHSYDLFEATDPRTGQKESIFFNIDLFYPPLAFRAN
jgi:hypothetical protein